MKKNWVFTTILAASFFIFSPVSLAQTQELEEKTLQLTFTSIFDYNECLDDVLLLYEGRLPEKSRLSQCIGDVIQVYGNSLSPEETKEILDLANFRATNFFDRKMYPVRGLRMKAAALLGYVYEIDVNDPQILALVEENRNQTLLIPNNNL